MIIHSAWLVSSLPFANVSERAFYENSMLEYKAQPVALTVYAVFFFDRSLQVEYFVFASILNFELKSDKIHYNIHTEL